MSAIDVEQKVSVALRMAWDEIFKAAPDADLPQLVAAYSAALTVEMHGMLRSKDGWEDFILAVARAIARTTKGTAEQTPDKDVIDLAAARTRRETKNWDDWRTSLAPITRAAKK